MKMNLEVLQMAKVITEEKIKEWISDKKVIDNGDITCAEGIKYDFRLGNMFLKAYFGRAVNYDADLKSAEDRRMAVVEPGEVVFVLSSERLTLPSNVYVQLSPKRSLSQDGIELLGGLTIDPGYEGYLVFGLRNVAGTSYTLEPGTKIVGANFFELSETEISQSGKIPTSIDNFPSKLLNLIEKYKPVNPQNLAEELKKLQLAFEERQGQLVSDVGELKEKVASISKDLLVGSTKQEQENKMLNERFSSLENKLNEINRDNVRQAESINSLKTSIDGLQSNFAGLRGDVNTKIDSFDKTLTELRDDMISKNAKRGVFVTIGTVVITFLITVLGGLLVALVQGWIG